MNTSPFLERRAQALRGFQPDDPSTFRPAMRVNGISIAELSRVTGFDYHRVEKIVNGRAKGTSGEISALAASIGVQPGAVK